jgi:hypothetical protein
MPNCTYIHVHAEFLKSATRHLEAQIEKYQDGVVPRFGGAHPTLVDAKGSDKGVWIHPLLAFRFARHCGLAFDDDASCTMRAFINSEELKALVGIADAEVNVRTDGIRTCDERRAPNGLSSAKQTEHTKGEQETIKQMLELRQCIYVM